MAYKWSYDNNGNVLSQSDPRNVSTYASYDALNRVLCQGTTSASVSPCSSSAYATYFYDSYDNSSNSSVTFPTTCSAPTGSYASDPIGGMTAETFGNSAGNGSRCYGYNQRGETDQSGLSVTADGTTTTQSVNMSYNDAGNVTSLVYPDGEQINYSYDGNDYLRSAYGAATNSDGTVNYLVGQISYTNDGMLSSMAYGGSANVGSTPTPVFTTSNSFDGIQRAIGTKATESGTTLWSETRTFDNVGNVISTSATLPTTTPGGSQTENQSFCYDSLNRLVWAGNSGTPTGGDHCGLNPVGTTIGSYQQSFSYDALDRLTSGPSGSETYGTFPAHGANTLSKVPGQYASYDAMGNMTCRNVDTGTTSTQSCDASQTGATMSYDNEGRLTSWTAPAGSTDSDQFLYDNSGNRVLQRASSSGTVSDTITFDGYTDVTISNGSTPSTSTTKYYIVGGQRVAMRKDGTLSYLLTDLLGSASVALRADGSVQAVKLYSPYGEELYTDGTMPTPYNFTGQRLDTLTGLLYYGARYYDPVSGRFISADTVDNNGSGNDPYSYVKGNIETATDPTGHVMEGADGSTARLEPSSNGSTNLFIYNTNGSTTVSNSDSGYATSQCVLNCGGNDAVGGHIFYGGHSNTGHHGNSGGASHHTSGSRNPVKKQSCSVICKGGVRDKNELTNGIIEALSGLAASATIIAAVLAPGGTLLATFSQATIINAFAYTLHWLTDGLRTIADSLYLNPNVVVLLDAIKIGLDIVQLGFAAVDLITTPIGMALMSKTGQALGLVSNSLVSATMTGTKLAGAAFSIASLGANIFHNGIVSTLFSDSDQYLQDERVAGIH